VTARRGGRRPGLAVLAGLAAMAAANVASGACPAQPVAVGRAAVTLVGDRVFFGVRELELDFDGDARAYGVRDQGREDICVGLAPLAPPACRGKFTGACYPVCRQAFAAWSRAGHDPATLPATMCSVGLGGGGCSEPRVKLHAPPDQDWFVSETSLKTAPDAAATPPGWTLGQSAQLDPEQVRYLVLPGRLTRPPWNLAFGDVGVAMAGPAGEPVPFIVGDGGGLGEGSVALLARLSPNRPPRLTPGTSALGETVPRYRSGVVGEFRFVIFRHTARLAGAHPPMTALPASKLMAWVDQTALEAFRAQSSPAELTACAAAR
jgi:hypothetical protein